MTNVPCPNRGKEELATSALAEELATSALAEELATSALAGNTWQQLGAWGLKSYQLSGLTS